MHLFGLCHTRALEGAAYLSHFLWYSRRKCKVGENAVLGLSKPELVRNACFYIELVSVTCDVVQGKTFMSIFRSLVDFRESLSNPISA